MTGKKTYVPIPYSDNPALAKLERKEEKKGVYKCRFKHKWEEVDSRVVGFSVYYLDRCLKCRWWRTYEIGMALENTCYYVYPPDRIEEHIEPEAPVKKPLLRRILCHLQKCEKQSPSTTVRLGPGA